VLKSDSAHIFVSPGAAEPDRRRLFHRIIDEIERYARDRGLSVSFLDVLATEAPLLQILRERGYCETSAAPKTRLDLSATSFTDYLRYLKALSPNSYKTARREINRSRAAGIDVQPSALEEIGGGVAFDLLQKHYARKNGKPFPHKADFVDVLKTNLPGNLLAYTATQGHRVVGVALGLKMGPVAWMPFVGIDHQGTQNEFIYFSLAFYAPIEDFTRVGLKHLLYGGAPHLAKLRRGFHLVKAFLLYKPATWLGALSVPICFAGHCYRQRHKYKSTFEADARYLGSLNRNGGAN
jgi:predicted N-acyltransferase